MIKASTNLFLRNILSLTVCTCALFVMVLATPTSVLAQPGGGGGGANCSITTVPSPATIDEGQSVQFTGSVSGKSPATYSWTFDGGSPGSSSQETVTVSYANAGSFLATLDGTNGKGQACTASVTVTVNTVNGNNAPVANDDAYSTNQDTLLSVPAPGVLGNDTDADNDPITVDTADTVTSQGGTVTVLTDGSFSYTPPSGFSGDDTFTYTATDGTDTSNIATVTITVIPVGGNNPPVANDDAYSTSQDTPLSVPAPGVLGNDTDADNDPITVDTADTTSNQGGSVSVLTNGSFSYTPPSGFTGDDTFSYTATDGIDSSNSATVTITVTADGVGPTARGDTYATPVGTPLDVAVSRVSGVLYNDFGGTPPLTAELVSGTSNGSLTFNSDGSFSYTPNASLADNDNDSFVYRAVDNLGDTSANTTVDIAILSKQVDFKIFMNYELGMHCTGFEFAYCCVLPPYNSILAQVMRPQSPGEPVTAADYPRLLEGDHHNTDGLGRPIVMRDYESDGTIKKYFLEYFHDAQPRREGQGKVQGPDTLISAVEGNSLFYHQTIYDSAAVDANGALVTGTYEGVNDVVLGDGDFNDPTDNYANGWLNHFYIYADLEGSNPNNSTLEADKIRLGVQGHIEYPADSGAALHPMGPTGNGAFDNVLTFSGDTGTVVYTQMKVLENLPVMLTAPGIWEALGLPLTPFEDSIDFFGDPGLVDEDSIRPYVAMKARLHEASCDADGLNCTQGAAVIGSNGHPVIGFGTAPIDIPNCERCHSVPADDGQGNPNVNSPSFIRTDYAFPHGGTFAGATLDAVTDAEYQFWNAYYNIIPGTDSDWYSRLKGAAINMLSLHDFDQGTGFTSNWPASTDTNPQTNPLAQNTRLGKESVICQKCHGDNVIAVVKSATSALTGNPVKPISEAIHWRHRELNEYSVAGLPSETGSIDFTDATGRSGGCQGCHPAHRSDGVMDGYPITLGGDNAQVDGDNRLASGGCFVGRDVHSNPMKDVDGAETPAHLNAVGDWLATNVFYNQEGEAGIPGEGTRGLWCTNCHTQLGQEIWKAEDCDDLINGDCVNNVRGLGSLSQIASAIGSDLATVESWLDPKSNLEGNTTPDGLDHSHRIWDPAVSDALLATIEVSTTGPGACAPLTGVFNPTFGVDVCVSLDADGDPSVNILSFCTTDDCVNRINGSPGDQSQWRHPANPFQGNGTVAAAVPFSAATDGRDHWLSPGEPHCADCHAAPYVEQSGNINPFPPFNYPAKASLMRYSKGHQGVTCQGCHESIHGLYPVTPTIDSTSYAQAAALNADGSHGPLKCGTCHTVDGDGIPTWIRKGRIFGSNLDDVTTWAHTYTDNADPLVDTCQNCHGDRSSKVKEDSGKWLRHAFVGRIGRQTQDKAEINVLGYVAGDPDTNGDGVPDRTAQDIANTVCSSCHSLQGGPSGAFLAQATCGNQTWLQHLSQGRIAEKVWEFISEEQNGTTCGW